MAEIHFDKITELMGDDKEMFIEMLEVFFEDIPVAINEIEDAWRSKEYDKLKAPCHKLKSSITWLNLMEAYESLKFLEHFSVAGGDMEEAEKHVNIAISDCKQSLLVIEAKLKEINTSV